jgi:hypothetical protein
MQLLQNQIKKKLGRTVFTGICSLGLALSLLGCLGEAENVASYTDYALVENNPQLGWILNTTTGPVYLSQTPNLETETFVEAEFTINYRDKLNLDSSRGYLTASLDKYSIVPQSPVRMLDSTDNLETEYNDSISSVNGFLSSPYFRGRVVIATTHKLESFYRLQLLSHPDSVTAGIPTIYLKARKEPSAGGTPSTVRKEAFDFNPLLDVYGKDTTYVYNNYTIYSRHIRFNLKYQVGVKDGKPVYKTWQEIRLEFEK